VNEPSDARPSLAGLAGRLRALRLATRPRVSQQAAAQVIGASQNKISRMEAGGHLLGPAEVRILARRYGAAADEVRRLVGWAEALAPAVADSRLIMQRGTASFQHRILRAEQAASHVRSFQPAVVLGVLQIEAYARVVFGDDADGIDARLQRNRQLLDDDNRRWTLIQTEGALLWNVGRGIMSAQIRAMIEASRSAHVDLRLITGRQCAPFVALHGFHLYDVQAVHFSTLTASTLTSNRHEIEQYSRLFGRLAELALTGDDARVALADIADRYRER
jgi:hypothetical protein